MKRIPYGRQNITKSDIDAVVGQLQGDWLTQGPAVEGFEKALSKYCGSEYCVAVSNGTAALHIMALAADLGPKKILWTSPMSFVATSNAGLYTGAEVSFVDIDPATGLMCPEELEKKLKEAKKKNKLPNAVTVVHYTGTTVPMDKIHQLSKEYGFAIMEDACHALGAKYSDETTVGSAKKSTGTIFSFHPVKSITTGEGGAILTNRRDIYEKLLLLRSHGITKEEKNYIEESHGPWYHEQQILGFNYRITDVQCALGLSQLNRLDSFIQKRRQLVERYYEKLSELPLVLLKEDKYSACHLFVVRIDKKKTKVDRKKAVMLLREAGIEANVHYIPIHQQPYYQKLGFKKGDYPKAESFYEGLITLPLYPDLSTEDQDRVIKELIKILRA